jgi:hypothetical protein
MQVVGVGKRIDRTNHFGADHSAKRFAKPRRNNAKQRIFMH